MRPGVVGKDAPDIEAVVQLENHHEAAPVDQDLHVADAGSAQALLYLRPDAAMVFPVGGDRPRIVAKIHRQHVSTHTAAVVKYYTLPVKSKLFAGLPPRPPSEVWDARWRQIRQTNDGKQR